jgi:hypothetical protein
MRSVRRLNPKQDFSVVEIGLDARADVPSTSQSECSAALAASLDGWGTVSKKLWMPRDASAPVHASHAMGTN